MQIRADGKSGWLVEVMVPRVEGTDYNLSKILLLAKAKISKEHSIPFTLLNYQDMTQKIEDADYSQVSFRIVSRQPEKGDPVLRFEKSKSDFGVEYEDMRLYLDIYPLKESGESLTKHDIELLLMKENITFKEVDMEKLENELKKCLNSGLANKNILLAEGKFPEAGKDGEIQYFVELKEYDINRLVSRKKIRVDEPICHLIGPIRSKTTGINVRGKKLYAPEPKENEIALDDGVLVSRDEQYVIAASEGILKIRIEKPRNSLKKKRYTFKVEHMVEVDGSEPVNITTDDHIEIKNGLKSGSSVISRGQVFIEGPVEADTRVTTSGDIIIRGDIVGSKMSGERDINALKKVTQTTLMAGGKLMVNGIATNSNLMGDEIYLKIASGCNVIAGTTVEVESILKNDEGYTGKISVGAASYTKEMIKDNEEFIKFGESTLKQIGEIVGSEVVESLTSANLSRIIMMQLNRMHRELGLDLSKEQTLNFKKVMNAVHPMREMIQEKGEAIKQFEERIKNIDKTKARIMVKSFINSTLDVEIEGVSGTILMDEGAVLIENQEGQLKKTSLKRSPNTNNNHNRAKG